jgi:hypothetical protein
MPLDRVEVPGKAIEAVRSRNAARRVALLWVLASMTLPANAAPELVGEFGAWAAYRDFDDGQPLCYVASQPERRNGTVTDEATTWILVTQDMKRNERNVVSAVVDGREFLTDASVRLAIGKRRFALHPDLDRAWTQGADDDLRVVVAMKRGLRMVLSAELKGGGTLIDSYSLIGFTKAMQSSTEACRL